MGRQRLSELSGATQWPNKATSVFDVAHCAANSKGLTLTLSEEAVLDAHEATQAMHRQLSHGIIMLSSITSCNDWEPGSLELLIEVASIDDNDLLQLQLETTKASPFTNATTPYKHRCKDIVMVTSDFTLGTAVYESAATQQSAQGCANQPETTCSLQSDSATSLYAHTQAPEPPPCDEESSTSTWSSCSSSATTVSCSSVVAVACCTVTNSPQDMAADPLSTAEASLLTCPKELCTRQAANALAQEACDVISTFARLVPFFGGPLSGIVLYVKHILEIADQVPYNKGMAQSLKRRTAMAAVFLQSTLRELQPQMHPEHLARLMPYIIELELAVKNAHDLVQRWHNLKARSKIVRILGRAVRCKLDLDELCQASGDLTKAMTHLGVCLTSILLSNQLQLQQQVKAALLLA